MKFIKKLLLISSTLFLSGCSILFSKDVLEPGFSNGEPEIPKEVSYYEGDSLQIENYSKVVIKAKTSEENPEYELEKVFSTNTSIENCLASTSNEITYTVGNTFSNIAQGKEGLFMGEPSSVGRGKFVLDLSRKIKGVVITAVPRNKMIEVETGYQLSIDKGTSISVNETKYIKLSDDFESTVEETTCSFLIDEQNSNPLTIYSYGGRVVIKDITLLF